MGPSELDNLRARAGSFATAAQPRRFDPDRGGLVLLLAQCDWRSIPVTRALAPLCAAKVDLAMLPA